MNNIFMIVLVSQAFLILLIGIVLWGFLDREMWAQAMEKAVSLHWSSSEKAPLDIMLMTTCTPDDKKVLRIKEVVLSSCPFSRIEVISSKDILGGVVLRCTHGTEDFSIMGRFAQIRGAEK